MDLLVVLMGSSVVLVLGGAAALSRGDGNALVDVLIIVVGLLAFVGTLVMTVRGVRHQDVGGPR
jgi:hypothetical protein